MVEKALEKVKLLYEKGIYDNRFYRRLIPGREVFDSYQNFCKIPFMYKQDIRDYNLFDRTTASMEEVYGLFSSSGSTGKKTFYVYTRRDKEVHTECVNRFLGELGVGSADLGAILAQVDTGVMAQSMIWQYNVRGAGYVNCPHPSPERIIELLEEAPVTVASTRPEIFNAIGQKKEWTDKARASGVRMILPGGGFVSESRRDYLETIWNAQCYNLYGMSEVFGPMAAECRKKKGQHYPDDFLLIEVIDPDTKEPIEEGEMGIAVYTTLWDKGFPLLRYWTDDFVILDNSPCACGSPMPRFYYQGRRSDCFHFAGSYLFPKDFEELIMEYDFYDDYEAIWKDGNMKVLLESKDEERELPSEFIRRIEDFFGKKTAVSVVKPETVGVFARHGSHFRTE